MKATTMIKQILTGTYVEPHGRPENTIATLSAQGIDEGNMVIRGDVVLYRITDEDQHYTYFDGAEPAMAATFEEHGPLTIKQIELVLAGENLLESVSI